jgi:hypothetical protein
LSTEKDQGEKAELRTYESILEDPWLNNTDRDRLVADSALGHTAVLLLQRNMREVAALLVEVDRVSIELDGYGSRDLWLEIGPEQRGRFTEEVMEQIGAVCIEVSNRKGYGIGWLGVREILPTVGPNWREQVRNQLGGKRPTNHARKVRTMPPQHVDDYLSFTNAGELAVYRLLKEIQEKDLPREDTLGIFPLAGGRLPGRTWEPDFLITYHGRAGVIEVDGPHHNARRALDMSRDHLYRDAGIRCIERIPVEALDSTTELKMLLLRFLRHLDEVK